MQIGDVVVIKENDSTLDCCKGKRGRIAHVAVGGGWLIHTDHFCPIPREDEDLILIPDTRLATEHLAGVSPGILQEYKDADDERLKQFAREDLTARSILILRGYSEYKL
jgi:hypothetical protein